jgi:rhomboid family GlyGly-CTERM serine protease
VPSSAESTAAGDAGRAWAALAAVLGLAAAAAFAVPNLAAILDAIDWQPALAWREPWRAWTAPLLHFSGLHLAANLAGTALVGALGLVGRVPQRTALAWFVAWPLTQFGLLVRPDLVHYGGLSGVLHAGVAAAALYLIVATHGPRRFIGAALLAALSIKVLGEAPWGEALRRPAGWDIAVAPLAHASGLVAGLLSSGIAETLRRRAPGARSGPTIDRNV